MIVTPSEIRKIEPPTGAEAQVAIARLKAGLISRYKLRAVPGRPEELEQRETGRRVSVGYGCRTIRVRIQEGRKWIDRRDYQIGEPSEVKARVFSLADPWFGYLIPRPPMRNNIV